MNFQLQKSLLIFLGCGLGGLSRYWITNAVYLWLGRQNFPYSTLIVNVSGSFFAGLLLILLLDRFESINSPLRALLLIGFLVGYTTFSTFSLETIALLETGRDELAGLNALLSIILCISFAWLGALLGRSL